MNIELAKEKSRIEAMKQLLDRYYLRLSLIDYNKADKSEYEKNEDEIVKIQTHTLIAKLSCDIEKKEEAFISLFNKTHRNEND